MLLLCAMYTFIDIFMLILERAKLMKIPLANELKLYSHFRDRLVRDFPDADQTCA
jgi:hypothetical protein